MYTIVQKYDYEGVQARCVHRESVQTQEHSQRQSHMNSPFVATKVPHRSIVPVKKKEKSWKFN